MKKHFMAAGLVVALCGVQLDVYAETAPYDKYCSDMATISTTLQSLSGTCDSSPPKSQTVIQLCGSIRSNLTNFNEYCKNTAPAS